MDFDSSTLGADQEHDFAMSFWDDIDLSGSHSNPEPLLRFDNVFAGEQVLSPFSAQITPVYDDNDISNMFNERGGLTEEVSAILDKENTGDSEAFDQIMDPILNTFRVDSTCPGGFAQSLNNQFDGPVSSGIDPLNQSRTGETSSASMTKSFATTSNAISSPIQSQLRDGYGCAPTSRPTSDQRIDYTSSIQDRFWADYNRAVCIDHDLFAGSDGDGSNPVPPLRESLRLFPRTRTGNEKAQALAYAHSVRAGRNITNAEGQSDWSGQIIHRLDHVPRRIDFETDLPNAVLDRYCQWIEDREEVVLKEDLVPRMTNFLPYDNQGDGVFDPTATIQHLLRSLSNRHQRYRDNQDAGFLPKYGRGDKRWMSYLTTVDQGGQTTLIPMESMMLNTRQPVDMTRMVFFNRQTGREQPCFTPADIPIADRICLEELGFHVPTLDHFQAVYPEAANYVQERHPLFAHRQAEENRWFIHAVNNAVNLDQQIPPLVVTSKPMRSAKSRASNKRRTNEAEHANSDGVIDPAQSSRGKRQIRNNCGLVSVLAMPSHPTVATQSTAISHQTALHEPLPRAENITIEKSTQLGGTSTETCGDEDEIVSMTVVQMTVLRALVRTGVDKEEAVLRALGL
jgi:hypothetical protein